MMYIKKFNKFVESMQNLNIDVNSQVSSNLMESLKTWHDIILSSIGASLVDLYKEFKLPSNFKIDDISNIADNIEFFNSLNSLGLRKSSIQMSDDYETFVNKPCKFMMIYNFDSNDLENPKYILFQSFNDVLKKWENVKLFKINGDIKKFYDKLTSKTIEVQDKDQNYIYVTSNGNDWELQNIEKENEIYKKFIRKEELQDILDSRGVSINII